MLDPADIEQLNMSVQPVLKCGKEKTFSDKNNLKKLIDWYFFIYFLTIIKSIF